MYSGTGYASEYRGLSTDTKPIENVVNGSIFLEMDTFKVFLFDKEHMTWIEVED